MHLVSYSCLSSVMFVLNRYIITRDLSIVDNTALVGMDGRLLAKHSNLLTNVVTKFIIFSKLSKKWNTSHDWLICLKQIQHYLLKAVDTIGNCQRLAFTVGVSQHMHKISNLWKFEHNLSSSCEITMKEKNILVTWSCVLSDAWFRELKI